MMKRKYFILNKKAQVSPCINPGLAMVTMILHCMENVDQSTGKM